MRHRIRRILILTTLLSAVAASAQMPIKYRVRPQVDPDTADLAYYGRKHFWRASAEIVGFNIGLWAYDRYIQNGDFARISFHTIAENFRHGFMWDNDKLGTNMFLHPYNGSLYYNSARANGFNYWQSSLFAIGGSAMWEMFMECEYPSTNDIIATPIGGACIGEVLFRASDAVLNDRSTGWGRFGREAAAFVISPMRGLTRIINGDAWRRRETSGRMFGTPNFAIQFAMGLRALQMCRRGDPSTLGASLEVDMEYGDRFEAESTKPFDFFTARADLNFMRDQPTLSQLNIMGRLLAREIIDTLGRHLSVGLYQHFDFYDSDTISRRDGHVPYKLGIPAALGAGAVFRHNVHRNFKYDATLHLNANILGGILSDRYNVDHRNYNMASGFTVKGTFGCVIGRNVLSLAISHEYYRMFTWAGYSRDINLRQANPRTLNVQGDYSCASFNISEFRASVRLWRHLYFTAAATLYNRSTRYRYYPHVTSTSLAARIMLTYKL